MLDEGEVKPMDFHERTVVITGGAKGIGAAAARTFSAKGASVAILDLNVEAGQPLARELGNAIFLSTDITKSNEVQAAVGEVVSTFGALHVLVNSAGVLFQRRLEETSDEDWERVLGVNLKAAFLTSRAAIPVMRRSGGGAIINVASVHALRTMRDHCAYAASKGGLVSLTQSIGLEYAQEHIRAVAILPGATHTPMMEESLTRISGVSMDEGLRAMGERLPMGRVADAQEIANVIVFASSSEASFITGSAIIVDGGVASGLPSLPKMIG